MESLKSLDEKKKGRSLYIFTDCFPPQPCLGEFYCLITACLDINLEINLTAEERISSPSSPDILHILLKEEQSFFERCENIKASLCAMILMMELTEKGHFGFERGDAMSERKY